MRRPVTLLFVMPWLSGRHRRPRFRVAPGPLPQIWNQLIRVGLQRLTGVSSDAWRGPPPPRRDNLAPALGFLDGWWGGVLLRRPAPARFDVTSAGSRAIKPKATSPTLLPASALTASPPDLRSAAPPV